MLERELVITIPGRAVPKGSLKCVGRRGRVAHVLIEDNTKTTAWRETVALAVRRKWPIDEYADKEQPIGAEITFTLPRPKHHYGTGRNANKIKPAYVAALPVGHKTGDVDKLLRLILDALQDARVLVDDCAVIEATTRKFYAGDQGDPDQLHYPGVVIRLYPYGGGPS